MDEKKAILLAPTPPPAGGISGWTERMMKAELKNGWKVSVVDEKVIGKRDVFGASSRRNLFEEIKRCFDIWKNLRKELKDANAKVVHSCIPSLTLSMMREYVCACITKFYKRKFIIHFRCTVPTTTKGRIGYFVLKLLCNKSDMVISLNEQTSACLRAITGTPITLIPNFISKEELVDEHEVKEVIESVVYVGGVVEGKGVNEVIGVAQRFPEIKFKLIGKGDIKYQKYCEDNEINNVVFVGPKKREEVKEELKNADVFIFMTYFRGEGFSNALCEAMAAGLPCIVTDWAANADMIGDDGGYVVKVGDVDAAVEALNNMRSPEVRAKQSEANIQKVRSRYTAETVIPQYVDLYESVINKK